MNRLVAEEVFLAKTKIKTCKCSFGEIQRTFFITLCRLQDSIDPAAVFGVKFSFHLWLIECIFTLLRVAGFCWHSKAGTFLHNVKVNEGHFFEALP